MNNQSTKQLKNTSPLGRPGGASSGGNERGHTSPLGRKGGAVCRTITLIVIHCSAVKPNQTSSAEQIDRWHRQQGFKLGIGYHYVIRRDGTIEPGRPESVVGAHCKNHNSHSIGVCYEGGLNSRGQPADTRTAEQKASLIALLRELKKAYPKALIVGHNVLNPQKACPCFDAAKEYGSI